MRCMIRASVLLLAMAGMFVTSSVQASPYRLAVLGTPVGQSFYIFCPDGETLVGIDFEIVYGPLVLENMAAVCSKTGRQLIQVSPIPKGLGHAVRCGTGQFVVGIKPGVKMVAGRPRIRGFHLLCRAPGGPITVAWMNSFDSAGETEWRCRGNDFVRGIGGSAETVRVIGGSGETVSVNSYLNSLALYCEDVPPPFTPQTLSVQSQPCEFCKKQVFANPTVNGTAMDVCLQWGKACGKPAADRFCTDRGFAGSVALMSQGNAPPTRIISDGTLCNATFCARMTSITCGRP